MTNRATHMFHVNWSNDYTTYHAVLGYARDLLRAQPEMADLTLGRNVRDTLAQWCAAAVEQHDDRALLTPTLVIMARDVGDFRQVDELAVAEDIRYALGVED